MLRLLWNLSNRVRLFLRTYMPTNILLDTLRTRRGLKWAVPAMLIAAPYLLGAWLLTVWIADGGPGWLNLLVLLFIWNALKFLVNGPITLIILIRARLAERRDRRLAERESAAYAADGDLPVLTATRI
ncbi:MULTISPECIES: sulfate permease [unclassified Rathayibacter]|uniref:sulfate permease n=1 Tax=unclassified Rathayibacter TaxID=2609250 RepID=UPI000CE7CE4E|nr:MULTISPECIES: sulfate permease [unclassified Rathayibacter]PPG06587.1 sulfate permease [Rathayibacter sp. AY2B1]PPG72663.1 sulfate permease [Rathayibacter sp. AY1F4]